MVQPFFSTANQFLGMLITGPIILGWVHSFPTAATTCRPADHLFAG
jgi:hypothetical protein